MKILCVIKTSHGARWQVAQAAALLARGHEVTVLLPSADGPLGTELQAVGATVRPLPVGISLSRAHLLPWDLVCLRRAIRAERPQVLFYQLWASAVMARLASVGLRGVRRVHMIPGPLFLDSAPIAALERVLLRLDHLIVAGSRYTADRYLRLGASRGRIVTIPYGVDVERFRPVSPAERAGAREALGIRPDAFVVVMVALVYGGKRLVHAGRPIKGHQDLLEAWRSFRPADRPKHLLLVGDGFDPAGRVHRSELLRAFGVEADASITWLPTVPDVRACYAAADVSVSPSLSDNHGAAAEASAMGVPSIVSDAGALPEAVQGSGWTFRAGNRRELSARLAEAASLDTERLGLRGRAARRHAEDRLDAARSLDQVVTVIEREGSMAAGRR